MLHRTPLTAERLAQIWDDHPSPVVLELLWEIHRLRSTILRADQIRRMIGSRGTHLVSGSVWECFGRELDAEPCLTDRPTPRQQSVIDSLVNQRRQK